MPIPLNRSDPLPQEIAKAIHVPVDRFQHFVIVVQYDTGVAMLHTLCCNEHAREGLALIATTPPDVSDVGRFTGSN